MPRLFVAIDLPDTVVRELACIQPSAVRGLRRTRPEQMHLTLHFLGETDLRRSLDALQTVISSAFSLTMKGVGAFGSARRGFILWAGFENSKELQSLYAALTETLILIGYQPEPRPFSPHITLARCAPEVPRRVIHNFIERSAGFRLPEFFVSEFSLYSSTLTSEGSVYHREGSFPLVI